MKFYLPGFLRKKMRSSSSSSTTNSDSTRVMATLASRSLGVSSARSSSSTFHRALSSDGNWGKGLSASSASTSSSASTGSSTSYLALSSERSWGKGKGVMQAQKVSAMGEEIVVLQETTGKVKSEFVSKSSLSKPNRDLEEAFLRFDANRDGKISTTELGSVLRSLGDNLTDEELLLMVKEVDRDGDGFIDLQEFILINSSCSSSGKEDLRQAFLIFDADADGKISVEELHHVLNRLGESCTLEECGRMIQGVDMDGDGFVDFEEFCTMMNMH